MILEVATLDVRPDLGSEFEKAFAKAEPIITSMPGYERHEMRRGIENRDRYVLLVWWADLESHTLGFRQSPRYQEWRELLHHFYDPFPTVEHFEAL